MIDQSKMTNEEAFEKWFCGDDYRETLLEKDKNGNYKYQSAYFAYNAWQAAIAYMQEHNKSAEQSEPVAEIILDPSFLPALRVPLIDWKTPIVDFEVGTKLYDKPQPLKRLDEDKINEIWGKREHSTSIAAFANAIMDDMQEINK